MDSQITQEFRDAWREVSQGRQTILVILSVSAREEHYFANGDCWSRQVILASAVAGMRYRRTREVAILKTIGATRQKIVRIFSLEFLVIGLIAGTIGAALACTFSVILIHRLFHAIYAIPLWPVISTTVLTALIAVSAGWAASFRILRQKPLEVLRQAED